MHRLLVCVCLAGVLSWLGESSAMAQTQNQPNRTPTTVGAATSPTAATPGGTNLNQGTGALPTVQDFGSGFVGSSQNQGRFIGSQFSGQQQVRGGGTGVNMFSGGRGSARGGGRFTMPNQSSRTSRTKRVRPRHRVAFSFNSRSMTTIKTSLDTRFSFLLPRRPEFKGVTIAVGSKAGELTLAGEVPNATARRMAVALVRMEPGVRTVTNQLSVVEPEPEPGSGQ